VSRKIPCKVGSEGGGKGVHCRARESHLSIWGMIMWLRFPLRLPMRGSSHPGCTSMCESNTMNVSALASWVSEEQTGVGEGGGGADLPTHAHTNSPPIQPKVP
jgi:hypothetical protein